MNLRPIPGHENYLVSDTGRVFKWPKEINPKKDKDGYLQLALWNRGKPTHFKVHRLVALAFLGPNTLQVNHKDGDKTNNHVFNLEYVTVSENISHAYRTGLKSAKGVKNSQALLNDELVLKIRNEFEVEQNVSALSRKFKINRRTLSDVVRRVTWSHV
jgi:hypothetical protein